MNASTVTPTGQAMTQTPAPVQHLLLSELAQVKRSDSLDNVDADKLALKATQITAVLKDILEHSSYRHGGLNE